MLTGSLQIYCEAVILTTSTLKNTQVNPVKEHRAVSWLKSQTTYSDGLLKPTFFVIVSLAFTSSCPGFEVESSVSWKALNPRIISNPNWADSVAPAKLLNCYLLTPIYPFHMYAFFNFFCFLNFFIESHQREVTELTYRVIFRSIVFF